MSVRRVAGVHRVPGDKSLTHRALMLAALAPGRSILRGGLTSLDAQSTAAVLRQLGPTVSPLVPGAPVEVVGTAGLSDPVQTLDCGNSGTTVRLMLGILAATPVTAALTGDASLRRRPMRRVTAPLRAMGARIEEGSDAGLPLRIAGGSLHEIRHELPVASAQVKGALLLAAAVAGIAVTLTEPGQSRDHTERMLRALGFTVGRVGSEVHLEPTGRFTPLDLTIPGDPSSAAFLVAAALLAGGGEITIDGVGLNPTRTAAFAVMRRMGAALALEDTGTAAGEPVGRITAQPSILRGTVVAADEIPGLIDEVPMLACLAARADGVTRFEQVGELRVKESDRLTMIATNLRAVGARAAVEGDDLIVEGTGAPLRGRVTTDGDHRIAMAFAVLGSQEGNEILIDDPSCAAVSYPGFHDALTGLFTGGAT